MKIKKFYNFINESIITDSIIEKITDDEFKEIKQDILDNIDKTLNDINDEYKLSDIKKIVKENIISGKDNITIIGLTQDTDITNFYHKHHIVIDKFLNDDGYLDDAPSENNAHGLYDVLIDGTKYTIIEMLKKLKEVL